MLVQCWQLYCPLKRTNTPYPSCSLVAHEQQLQALHIFPAAPPPPHDRQVSLQGTVGSVSGGWGLLQQLHLCFQGGACHQGTGEAGQWGRGLVVMMHTLNNKPDQFYLINTTLNVKITIMYLAKTEEGEGWWGTYCNATTTARCKQWVSIV